MVSLKQKALFADSQVKDLHLKYKQLKCCTNLQTIHYALVLYMMQNQKFSNNWHIIK